MRSRSRSTLIVSPSPDSSSNCVSPCSRSVTSASASAWRSAAWRTCRSRSSSSSSLSFSSVFGVMFGDCFGTKIPDSGHVVPAGSFFAGGSGLTLAAFFAAGVAAFFAGALAALAGAFFATLAGAFFTGAAFLAGAFLPAPSSPGTAFLAAALAGAFFAGTAFFAAAFVGGPFFAGAADFFAGGFFTAETFFAGAAFVRGSLFHGAHRAPFRGRRQEAGDVSAGPEPPRGWIGYERVLRSRRSTPRSRRARRPRPGPSGRPDDVFAESLRRRAGAPEWVFYEGPPTANGRPGHPPRLGPPLQGHLPALPHDAGQVRRPEGGLGLPRPAGRGRGREGARLLRQAPDRGLRDRGVQPALPRVGAALRRGLVGADQPHRHVARPLRRLHHDEQRVHRERLVAVPRALGQGRSSTRARRSSPTAAGAARRSRATSSASPARTRTSPRTRSTSASRSSTPTSTSSCGRPRRGRS